ncbi:HD domain-containing protein [Desulfovibrio sp. OttesenSCG-928-C06]|nr:HD domain-containing protein [Desulfovibrio sp. OttesenSCG-928-C06]
MYSFSINTMDLVRTLSTALDLVVGGVSMHQMRTAAVCRYISDEMGSSPTSQQVLLNAALLHDIGAAPDLDERRRLASAAQTELFGAKIYRHAEAGWELLRESLCFGEESGIIRHHHDRWEGGNPSGLSGRDIPLASRIISLSDRVEVQIDKTRPVLGQREDICARIAEQKGKDFDPDVVEAFLACAARECFWLDITHAELWDSAFAPSHWESTRFTAPQMLNVASLFATLIDRKSAFTATHSRSVSNVAVLLASRMSFCQNELYLMKIAGLLHDLGKLAIHNSILEKPGPLTPDEMQAMRQHTYYTYRLLEQIDAMQQVAQWAAFHHETLDGKGYPFQLGADMLPLGSRIMAVADIFVALAENRPYRNRMEATSVKRIMTSMADRGKIDPRVLDILFSLYDEADAIVLASEGGCNHDDEYWQDFVCAHGKEA